MMILQSENEDLKAPKGKIKAEKLKIEQILVNLIDNAVKYSHEGGVVDIRLRSNDKTYTLVIKDDGPGIPVKDIDRVFERFYRVDKARSREIGGTGLGLAIVRRFVSLHEGTIDLKSSVGKGVEITLKLPKK